MVCIFISVSVVTLHFDGVGLVFGVCCGVVLDSTFTGCVSLEVSTNLVVNTFDRENHIVGRFTSYLVTTLTVLVSRVNFRVGCTVKENLINCLAVAADCYGERIAGTIVSFAFVMVRVLLYTVKLKVLNFFT